MHSALLKKERMIYAAYSSEEAAAIASEQLVDIIILDIGASKQGWSDFMNIKSKRHKGPNIPVFMLSSNDTLQTKLLSYVRGAKRFFPKPVDIEELSKEIEKYEIKNMKEAIA